MRTSTVVCLAVAFVGYGAFLHASRARAQSRIPSEPALPMFPAMPAMPAQPAMPTPPAMPAMPAEPAIPAMPALPSPAFGFGEYRGTWNHQHEPAEDCSDLHIRLRDDERPVQESEERTLTKSEAPVLRLHEVQNGGVQVQGWDKDVYSVTACKAAVGSDEEAHRLLSQIKLSVQGGEVSVSGPDRSHNDWTVYLLIRTPKGADVELSTHNGPAAFFNVDGKIMARATNGPISIQDCSGEGDIEAQNGPIDFSGTSGKLRLHTDNGPISISLNASTWTGGLVADAANGPLELRVPSGFQSSFLVESSEHAPMSCRASICSQTRRTWDDNHRRIEFGSGEPLIRLTTHNGPISVNTL
jgi:hypothetical protein